MLSVDEIIGVRSESALPSPVDLRFITYDCFTAAMASQSKTLLNDEIHLWQTEISGLKFDPADVNKLLSPDELERMKRFHFEPDRRNFLFCRSVLRILLASYLGSSPAELRFAYSAHGKPSLVGSVDTIEFNLSHSENQLLIAVCRGRKVGVDIEKADLGVNVMDIAQRFFSPAELGRLEMEPPDSRYKHFYSCWTLKEAWLKARGDGLSFPLSAFDVYNREVSDVQLITRPEPSEALKWRVFPIATAEGFAAAVAVERRGSC